MADMYDEPKQKQRRITISFEDELILKLIASIEPRADVWDHTRKGYRISNVVDNLWLEIYAELNTTIPLAMVKSKWSSLRVSHNRIFKQMKYTKSGQASSESKVTWRFYSPLNFLTNMSIRAMSHTKSNLEDIADDEMADGSLAETASKSQAQSVVSLNAAQTSARSNTVPFASSRFRKPTALPTDNLSTAIGCLQNAVTSTSGESSQFATWVTNSIMSLPPHRRLHVKCFIKKKIAEEIKEAAEEQEILAIFKDERPYEFDYGRRKYCVHLLGVGGERSPFDLSLHDDFIMVDSKTGTNITNTGARKAALELARAEALFQSSIEYVDVKHNEYAESTEE